MKLLLVLTLVLALVSVLGAYLTAAAVVVGELRRVDDETPPHRSPGQGRGRGRTGTGETAQRGTPGNEQRREPFLTSR